MNKATSLEFATAAAVNAYYAAEAEAERAAEAARNPHRPTGRWSADIRAAQSAERAARRTAEANRANKRWSQDAVLVASLVAMTPTD